METREELDIDDGGIAGSYEELNFKKLDEVRREIYSPV